MEFINSLAQYNDVGLLVLRLAVAIVFIYHALPKLMKPGMVAKMLGAPSSVALVMGIVELAGGLALAVGYQMQLAALVLGVIMVGAIGMKMMMWKVPFASMEKTGWEFDLMILAACVALLLGGGGSLGLA